jgi:hypothetical protein
MAKERWKKGHRKVASGHSHPICINVGHRRRVHQPNAQTTQPPIIPLVGTPKIYRFFKVLRKFSKLLRRWKMPQKV